MGTSSTVFYPLKCAKVGLAYARWVQSLITTATVIRASEISDVWKISFWDGLIVAAADESGASELLSEDMNHGQLIAGIRIVNPFVPTDHRSAN